MFFSRQNNKDVKNIENSNINKKALPKHVGIIMDGNGRWAKKRGLPRVAGHTAGVEALREIIKSSSDIGIEILSLYAFSTENWKRPKTEVDGLMSLLVEYLNKEVENLHKNNVQIRTIGNINALPKIPKNLVTEAIDLTRNNNGLIVNIALNYGGRDEIIFAMKNLLIDIKKGNTEIEDIDEKNFGKYLYTSGLPDVDLLIRPSGELRVSNFLIWQIAYAELWFTDILWPDFTKNHLLEAINSYQNRDRRFGGLTNK